MNKLRIGILGDGQLAKYLTTAATNLGFKSYALGLKVDECIPRENQVIGNIYDQDDLISFAKTVDIITLENEFIPLETLEVIKHKLIPSFEAFSKINDKIKEKHMAKSCGIPIVPYQVEELNAGMYKGPAFYKLPFGGYDGKGNFAINSEEDFIKMYVDLNKRKIQKIIREDFFLFDKEVSITLVRNDRGEIEYYPIVDTIQKNNVCDSVSAPSLLSQNHKNLIKKYSSHFVERLAYVGVMSIEFFIKDEGVYYNECSPRPHNSAHYTMDACFTSQFENHIRAITEMTLGLADLKVPCAYMINVLGQKSGKSPYKEDIEKLDNESFFYNYGKIEERIGRKMGHLSLVGENKLDLELKAQNYISKIHKGS